MSSMRRLIMASFLLLGAAAPAARAYADEPTPYAPTYTVFATREGLVGHRTANGHRIISRDRFVALPSWHVLSSKGGGEFQVRVTYHGHSVVLPVWDVGPWNTDDDYWSPQRRYSELPVGLPMAQAAYNDGYNGGRDVFGRRIRMPNGIDIADGAFWDDLSMTSADWVEVTFLWLGQDPGPVGASDPTGKQIGEPDLIEPGAAVVDNGVAGYDAQAAVHWYDEGCGQNGRHAWTYGTPDPARSENRARWTPTLPGPAFYEVQAYIPACGRPATRSARYQIVHGGATTAVVVDQRATAGSWVSLGIYHIADEPASVELSDVTGDKGMAVRFDAVKWIPRTDAAPPSARVTEARRSADGGILVRWSGADDVSGVAAYDVQVRRHPDGGWIDWQAGATTGTAVFMPPGAGVYAFRARARDWVGNVQPWREADDVVINMNE